MVEDQIHRKDAYIAKLIRSKARSLCRRASFSASDFEDIQQDLWVHLLGQQEKFDPNLATFNTFANRVINNKVCSIIRHSLAKKRTIEREDFSLHERVDGTDKETIPRSDTIADTTFADPDHRDAVLDAEVLDGRLDAEARAVLKLRRRGRPQKRVAAELGISPRRVTAAIERVRKAAADIKLFEDHAQHRSGPRRYGVDR